MSESYTYFGSTYCCPACGTSFSLIIRDINGTGIADQDVPVLRCPACYADNAIRVSQPEMKTIAAYVLRRTEVKQLIQQRMNERKQRS